jgi:putative ABC transport system ATP-binding protein
VNQARTGAAAGGTASEVGGATGALFGFEAVSVVAPDGTPILLEVQLELPADRTTVVVGPSGAGKSTLLRLCNRLEVPTSGTVRFHDTPLDELDPRAHRRRVGMVFQQPTTFPGSVGDNLLVAHPGADHGALHDVLQAVGLDGDLHDREADQLSGGEAQRLCIARALLTGPEVLLLDEPTSSLDEGARDEVEALTDRLRERGVVLVWVTHDQAQAARRGDHVVALRGGRVAYAGDVAGARAEGVLRPEEAA